jgi:hypothetical protein
LDEVPDHLRPALEILRRMYPGGIPEAEYEPLLAALHIEMPIRGIATLVSALTGRDYAVVANDARGTVSPLQRECNPPPEEVARVWDKLRAAGWVPEASLRRYEMPWFTDEAAGILRRAYPSGLASDDYRVLLAALSREVDLASVTNIVTSAFPDRDPVNVFNDTATLTGVPEDLIERAWRRLRASGWITSSGA